MSYHTVDPGKTNGEKGGGGVKEILPACAAGEEKKGRRSVRTQGEKGKKGGIFWRGFLLLPSSPGGVCVCV